MTTTVLDQLKQISDQNPDDIPKRMQFFAQLMNTELFLLLMYEPKDEQLIDPKVLNTDEGDFLLAFDTQERLVDFSGHIAPYVALSARTIIDMIRGQGIGLGINLGVEAASEFMLISDDINWLHEMINQTPSEHHARPIQFSHPTLPKAITDALAMPLLSAAGLADHAYAVQADYDTGEQRHMLFLIGVEMDRQAAMSNAILEALNFSGIDAGSLDVTFINSDNPIYKKLAQVGVRFDIPKVENILNPEKLGVPILDPDKPPRLK